MFKAYEDLEMVLADALEGDCPSVLMVLTTPTPTLDMQTFRAARMELQRCVRRALGGIWRYLSLVEYTTGYGPRSGGLRRPHWNYVSKGLADELVPALREVALPVWCEVVGASLKGQYVEELRSGPATIKYLIEHFGKASQRPPEGFTGQRMNCSRDYFADGSTVARKRARESQALKRELWKAEQTGCDPVEAHAAALASLRAQAATDWIACTATGARLADCRLPPAPLVDRLGALISGAL
jgi:hypothetical protein